MHGSSAWVFRVEEPNITDSLKRHLLPHLDQLSNEYDHYVLGITPRFRSAVDSFNPTMSSGQDDQRKYLKPGCTFDYVPIKEVNVGDKEGWFNTASFIDTVSRLSQDDDVKACGGFMVIRAKNFRGAHKYIYQRDDDQSHDPKCFDMNSTDNLYGIPNLKCNFKAQIHNQRCKEVKSQLMRWKDPTGTLYDDNNRTVKQRFDHNVVSKSSKSNKKCKSKSKGKSNNKSVAKIAAKSSSSKSMKSNTSNTSLLSKSRVVISRRKRSDHHEKTFDVITDRNGDSITQTQSGRIVKVKCAEKDRYELLDRWLEGRDNDDDHNNTDDDQNDDTTESDDDDEEEEGSDYQRDEDTEESEDMDTDHDPMVLIQNDENEDRNGMHGMNGMNGINPINGVNGVRKRKREDIEENATKKRRLSNGIIGDGQSAKIKMIEDGVFTLDYSVNGHKQNSKTDDASNHSNGNTKNHGNDSDHSLSSNGRELESKESCSMPLHNGHSAGITKDINVDGDSNGVRRQNVLDDDILMSPCTAIRATLPSKPRNGNTITTTNGHNAKSKAPKMRYQYPLQIEEAMPEPDDIDEDSDHSAGFKVVTRDTYTPAAVPLSKPRSNYIYGRPAVESTNHDSIKSNGNTVTTSSINKDKIDDLTSNSSANGHHINGNHSKSNDIEQSNHSNPSSALKLPSLSLEPEESRWTKSKSKSPDNTDGVTTSTTLQTSSNSSDIVPMGRPKAPQSKLEDTKKCKKSEKKKPKSIDSIPSKITITTKKKETKHINRGFACVIEQIENKSRKEIQYFFNETNFTKHLQSSIYDNASPEEIPLIFSDHLATAQMVQYAIVDQNSVYHFESPVNLLNLSKYGPFKRLNLDEKMLGIQTPYVYVGQQHTFFPFHREDMNFYAVNHLLWGCHKLWYCIHPKDHAKVIEFVREQYCQCSYNINGYEVNWNECETPLQHKLFWFDPYILLSLGIRVWFIRQQPGDIVITPPGGIHGGLNAGPNLAESINFMSWDVEQCWKPVLGAMLHYMHNHQCAVCTTHAFVDVNRLAQRIRDGTNGRDDDFEDEEQQKITERDKKRAPGLDVIAEALPILKRSREFMKYNQADRRIARTFTWANRQQLRSRYLNSRERELFESALQKGMVYPFYEMKSDADDSEVVVYPVRYEGVMDHLRDSVVFVPTYLVSFLHDDERSSERVTIDHVIREYVVQIGDWKCQFEEEQIEMALKKKLGRDTLTVTFAYRPPVISPKSLRVDIKLEGTASVSPRRKKRRVICDSDSDD